MAVTLELTQSGSGSIQVHAQKGDTVTLKGASVAHNHAYASAIAGLNALSQVTGVTFVLDATAGASNCSIAQSGSGTNSQACAKADSVTIVLAGTVMNHVLAWAVVQLQRLTNVTGVSFVLSTAGNAS